MLLNVPVNFFLLLFPYIRLCRLMESQEKYECPHSYYAVIDVAVVWGHTAMETYFSIWVNLM